MYIFNNVPIVYFDTIVQEIYTFKYTFNTSNENI